MRPAVVSHPWPVEVRLSSVASAGGGGIRYLLLVLVKVND